MLLLELLLDTVTVDADAACKRTSRVAASKQFLTIPIDAAFDAVCYGQTLADSKRLIPIFSVIVSYAHVR